MTHKWRAVADSLAAAMQHSANGFCTLTDNEHAALALYREACEPGPMKPMRETLGFTGGPDAVNHSEHAPNPEFVLIGSEPPRPAGTWIEECPTCHHELVMTDKGRIA